MAQRKKKKKKNDGYVNTLLAIARKHAPHSILRVLAKEYDSYISRSAHAEQDFWIKCARASANLSSGMEKWLEEWIDEEES